MHSIGTFALVALCALTQPTHAAQTGQPSRFDQDTISHVDYYGLRSIGIEAIQEVLGLDAGAPSDVDRDALCAKLRAMDGVADATIMLMHSPSRTIALVGIEEEGAPELRLRPEPAGDFRLPEAFHSAYEGSMRESMNGYEKGIGGEDTSDGHSMSVYPPARAHEEETLRLVPQHLELLRKTLRHAADPTERLVAADAIAFAADKQSIIPDLAYAMTDPSSGVRNNSVRALGVLVHWSSQQERGLEFEIDPAPLLTMLESLEWTDRNKSAALLDKLTSAGAPKILQRLRAGSIPALEEMALWHSAGHAYFSIHLLARLAGLSEEELDARVVEIGYSNYDSRAAWVRELVGLIDAGDRSGERI